MQFAAEAWKVEPLLSARLLLEPLRVSHAEEMAALLDDSTLHTYIGGQPASSAELRDRYGRQSRGRSPDGHERWLNWIVRRRDDGQAVGTVQATVSLRSALLVAQLAWVTAAEYQGQGYAREAAYVVVAWLTSRGVVRCEAYIHPDHVASQRVARHIGLEATETLVDGEVRWLSSP